MSLDLYLGFIAATIILCVIPGPVVTWLVACGIAQGPRAALTGLAGTTAALSTHMVLTVLGLAPLLAALGPWAEALKMVGAAYLVFLGVQAFRAHYADPDLPDARRAHANGATLFRRGYLISVTNPKTLAFYAAFFPQFIDHAAPAGPQLVEERALEGHEVGHSDDPLLAHRLDRAEELDDPLLHLWRLLEAPDGRRDQVEARRGRPGIRRQAGEQILEVGDLRRGDQRHAARRATRAASYIST